ncbi:uncharacterized protein [Arachis hypogaea]|uniref:uncharacterized protein isoform X2 n=1 Tax=Arachis hypogaea TaxID=3818 RepID=UPI003B225D3D
MMECMKKKASSSSHTQVRRTFDSLSNDDGVHGKKANSSSHSQLRRQIDSLSNDDGVHGKKESSSSHSQVRRTFDSLSNNDRVHGKKASSSSHSQLRRQFDSLSNDDEVDEEEFESDFVAPKKKARGPTRNLELAKLSAGKRLDINWRMNRPVGPNAKLFKSRCTVLVRDVKNAPLKVKEWAYIKIENKIKMFDLVLFEQTGQEIDHLHLWELTHTRANGQACNEETQEKLVDLIPFKIYLRNYHLK